MSNSSTPADPVVLTLGVVVLNFEDWPSTAACVKAVLDAAGRCSWKVRVLVVDNGSVTVAVEPLPAGVELLCLPSNMGFGAGNNSGIEWFFERKADAVLVLNNDTVVDEAFLQHLTWDLSRSPATSVVVPEIRYMSQPTTIWYCGGSLDLNLGKARHWGVGALSAEYRPPDQRITFASGCAMAIPRAAWGLAGPFPSDLFLYWEDVEWSLRLLDSGCDIRLNRAAVVWHMGGGGSAYRGPQGVHYYYWSTRNRLVVIRRAFPRRKRTIALFRTPETVGRDVGYLLLVDRTDRWTKLRAIARGLRDGARVKRSATVGQ